ncbi:MAG TPA: hypothetical protein VFN73_10840, partial [Propionibacteriaceae bacterium]|nr:hypothetical protein [Propionibacteriaceae bacterium]
MSPGATCWGWIIALVLVVRRRSAPALALFLPAAALGLTVMAGPVSGGLRYLLAFFMALPLAAAAAALAGRSRRPV